jgi:hypothetical protein
VRTQLVDGLLADLLQDARFLRVYNTNRSKSLLPLTGHIIEDISLV